MQIGRHEIDRNKRANLTTAQSSYHTIINVEPRDNNKFIEIYR